jgi:hypothetical protein
VLNWRGAGQAKFQADGSTIFRTSQAEKLLGSYLTGFIHRDSIGSAESRHGGRVRRTVEKSPCTSNRAAVGLLVLTPVNNNYAATPTTMCATMRNFNWPSA